MEKNRLPIFLLKTDISEEKIPFIAAVELFEPGDQKSFIPPVIEDTVENYFLHTLGTADAISDTMVVRVRGEITPLKVRAWVSVYTRHRKKFLLFICDCIQRADHVMSHIETVYSQKYISRHEWEQERT